MWKIDINDINYSIMKFQSIKILYCHGKYISTENFSKIGQWEIDHKPIARFDQDIQPSKQTNKRANKQTNTQTNCLFLIFLSHDNLSSVCKNNWTRNIYEAFVLIIVLVIFKKRLYLQYLPIEGVSDPLGPVVCFKKKK